MANLHALTPEPELTPGQEMRLAVRKGLRDIRIAVGETTAEAEDYVAKHARQSEQMEMFA